MEKTDTIILSPEELAAYMAESTISVTSTYEHSPVVLMVDDTVIGTLGNFSASIGKAKSKKTFNISAIVASALSGSTVLHYRSTFPENKRKILYIDRAGAVSLPTGIETHLTFGRPTGIQESGQSDHAGSAQVFP